MHPLKTEYGPSAIGRACQSVNSGHLEFGAMDQLSSDMSTMTSIGESLWKQESLPSKAMKEGFSLLSSHEQDV